MDMGEPTDKKLKDLEMLIQLLKEAVKPPEKGEPEPSEGEKYGEIPKIKEQIENAIETLIEREKSIEEEADFEWILIEFLGEVIEQRIPLQAVRESIMSGLHVNVLIGVCGKIWRRSADLMDEDMQILMRILEQRGVNVEEVKEAVDKSIEHKNNASSGAGAPVISSGGRKVVDMDKKK